MSKLKGRNDLIYSERKKIYKIKKILELSDKNMSKHAENELEYEINEDTDVINAYKELKIFSKSFKVKVNHYKKDITKWAMITKKNADIINFCDMFSKRDDLYCYKNKKTIIHNYSALSKRARKEPFKKEYKKINYKYHEKILERNAFNIRMLIKSCQEAINKIHKF